MNRRHIRMPWGWVFAGIIIFVLISPLTGVDFQNPEQESGLSRIVIFHVNDVHGHISNFAKIAWLINEERRINPNVFFLSAGDNFTGDPYVDQSHPKGEPILELFNHMKLDVLALGNHDFDYGQEILKSFILRGRFNVVCANLSVTGAGIIPQPKPYVILRTRDGLTIAVLGLIQISKFTRLPDTHPDHVRGLTFSDEIQSARQYRFLARESDLFIALTHQGVGKDEKLAREMKELDLIVGGHSHTVIDRPREVGGVLIVQTGQKGKYLGKVELEFSGHRLIGKRSELIDLGRVDHEDSLVKKMLEVFFDNPELDMVIAVLKTSVEGKQVLGNLVTDAICDILGLDMALYNSGGIRIHRLGPEVKLWDVYALHPFGNDIVVFEMTAAELRSLIRYDYEHVAPLDIQVSGLSYRLKATKDRRLLAIYLYDENGDLLDEIRTYRVGMNNYMASAYTFNHRDPGRSSHQKMVDVMIQYLNRGKIDPVRVKNTNRSSLQTIKE